MSVEVTTTAGNSVTATTSEGTTVSFTSTSSSVSVTSPASSSISILAKGPKGDTGATGSTGSTGATGATGAAGPTYSISCVDGDNSDEEKIRLTGSDSSTDDVVLEAGTGLSIARSGDKITLTNTVSDTDTNTQLSTEEVQDIVGGMFSSNTETRVTATYVDGGDGAGKINVVVDDMTANDNTQLSTEEVQDIAGPLVATGGTKTNIAVTYDDASGNMDFVVASDLNTTGNAGTATALATARAINGVDFDGTAPITVTAAGSTLSDTVTVAKGGTGLTTVGTNEILTGNGTSALTSESNLTFGADRLIIGADAEITPQLRLKNDENTVTLGVADATNNLISGSVDGDFVIDCSGDHNVLISQNSEIALTVDTNGDSNFNRRFTVTGDTDGTYEGDVVYFGGTTSMTTGALYHYKSDGTWETADANAASTCDGLLAIALGAASDTNGMLLRGMVTVDHDTGSVGDVLFASTTAGDITATAPSGNNDIVRVVGYCLHASNGQIWFNPDGTFVEVTA
tara:strand:+ start:4420 stop:5961 length:1542 start_codon:yes stop_codon:yes gene_type:complete